LAALFAAQSGLHVSRAPLTELEVADLRQWRRWLAENHAASAGVWLVFRKRGAAALEYEDAVRAALCVGWIDSLVKRLHDARYARKFTPRRPASKWSAINRRRWAELDAAGALKPAGRAAAPSANAAVQRPVLPGLPAYLASALRANPKAWQFFQTLAPGYRRLYVAWIHAAKRPETRERRTAEAVTLLAAGKKLGLK
jgi:uncharacterized protein YdeI (YjbR/CyaY-like superfamily)